MSERRTESLCCAVHPYLNLYAHPGLMYELYAVLTLGRSEA